MADRSTDVATSSSTGLKLFAFLSREGADGRYLYSRREVQDLFCLLLLSSRCPAESVPPLFRRLLGEFVLKIGYSPRDRSRTLSQAVDAYFMEHPIDATLVGDFRTFMKEELGFNPAPPLRKMYFLR